MIDTNDNCITNSKLQFININNLVTDHLKQLESLIEQNVKSDIKYIKVVLHHPFTSNEYKITFGINISSMSSQSSFSDVYRIPKVQRDQLNNDPSNIHELATIILTTFQENLQKEIQYQNSKILDYDFLETQYMNDRLLFSNYDYAMWAVSNLTNATITQHLSFILLNDDEYFIKLFLSIPNLKELLQKPNVVNTLIKFLAFPQNHVTFNYYILYQLVVKAINQPNFNFNNFDTYEMFALAIKQGGDVELPLCIITQSIKNYKKLHHLLDVCNSAREHPIQITFKLVDENDLKALVGFVLASQSTIVVKKVTNLQGITASLNGQRGLITKYLNDIKTQQQDWNNSTGFNCIIDALKQLLDYDNNINKD